MNFYALNVTPINGWETHLGQGIAAQAVTGTASHKQAVTARAVGTVRVEAKANALFASTGRSATQLSLSIQSIYAKSALGQGHADLMLSIKPVSSTVLVIGSGFAQMTLQATARPSFIAMASGVAELSLDGHANADLGKTAHSTAGMSLDSDARAILRHYAYSVAPLSLIIDPSRFYVEIHPHGIANMELEAASFERIAHTGEVSAAMSLLAPSQSRMAKVGKVNALMRLEGRYTIPYPPRPPLTYSPAHPTATMRQPYEARVLTATPDRKKMRSPDSQSVRITRREPCLV